MFVPCWIRMEHNRMGNIQSCIHRLEKESSIRFCIKDERYCTSWKCKYQSHDSSKVPHIRLTEGFSKVTQVQLRNDWMEPFIKEELIADFEGGANPWGRWQGLVQAKAKATETRR